jgi:type II secretory pathway pseudopilin PulG
MTAPRFRGMSIVEVVIGIGIFSLLSLVAYQLYSGVRITALREGERNKALWLAEEGIEATRSMRDVDFARLTDGTHGLTLVNTSWSFVGTSDTMDRYVRSVTITPLGEDTKEITSLVEWRTAYGVSDSVHLTTVLTNWRKAVVETFTGTMADALSIDISGVRLGTKEQGDNHDGDGEQQNGGKGELLTGIVLGTRAGATTTEITAVTVTWTKKSRELKRIYSPVGRQVFGSASMKSGKTATLTRPIRLSEGTTSTIAFDFGDSMRNSDFNVVFILRDGSTTTINILGL